MPFFFFFSLRNLKEAKASQIACGARKLTGLAPNLTEAIAYQPLVLLQSFVNNGSIVHLFFNSASICRILGRSGNQFVYTFCFPFR